jgi:hypothetical protein
VASAQWVSFGSDQFGDVTVHRGSGSCTARKALVCRQFRSLYWRRGHIANVRYSTDLLAIGSQVGWDGAGWPEDLVAEFGRDRGEELEVDLGVGSGREAWSTYPVEH